MLVLRLDSEDKIFQILSHLHNVDKCIVWGAFFFNTANLKAMRLLTNYVIIYPSLEPGVLFQPYILLTHFQTSSQSKIICDKTPGSMSTVKLPDLLICCGSPSESPS